MKAWIANYTGDYFETDDKCSYSKAIATQVKPKPSTEADQEIKIQKEMNRLLREQAMKNLGITPLPIEPITEEPTPETPRGPTPP